jgi:uncharacterized protein with PQ loop repeat
MNLVSKASFHREPSPSKIAHFIGIFRLPFTAVILFYTVKYRVKVKGSM